MSNSFFIADCHFGHANAIRYCKRPFIKDRDLDSNGRWISKEIALERVNEMNEFIIDKWNNKIGKYDHVYHIGDFAFCDPRPILKRLNGFKHLLIGDHDQQIIKWREILEKYYNCFDFVYMKRFRYCKQEITLLHWKMEVWPRSHYNSWHCYGHCLDLQTEILTNNGWKFRSNLNKNDLVLNLNQQTKLLEYNSIDEIVDYPFYSGEMYHLKSKGVDTRITSNHVMVCVNRSQNKINKILANELSKVQRRTFIRSGILKQKGIDLSDNFIKLFVWVAADGNICNSNLIRIRVLKKRKITAIRKLLKELNICFNEKNQKDNSISFNFNLPKEIINDLKPLSKRFEYCNEKQLEILLKEYSITDGEIKGNTYIIYTSKKIESDIIQIACIKNGYCCNITVRNRLNRKPNYTLIITKRQFSTVANISNFINIENVLNEYVWCVKVKHQNIFIRRNGKTLLVGNSHGRLSPKGKSWDVGVDNNNFEPLSFDEISDIMAKRPDNFNLVRNKKY